MLPIFTERLTPPPFVFSSAPGDEPPPDEEGDPPPPGVGKIKPPTVNQPASSESQIGIKPPTATDTGEGPVDDVPPSNE
jgi:hypothetical protein